jgi:hypothetical protein
MKAARAASGRKIEKTDRQGLEIMKTVVYLQPVRGSKGG